MRIRIIAAFLLVLWIGRADAQAINPTTIITTADGVDIVPTVSTSAVATLVLKNGPGDLYSVYATNLTATAGFLVVVNAASAPADGAITPLDCVPLPASGNASLNYGPAPPAKYTVGITAIVTSGSTCFVKTTGTITAFIHGSTP